MRVQHAVRPPATDPPEKGWPPPPRRKRPFWRTPTWDRLGLISQALAAGAFYESGHVGLMWGAIAIASVQAISMAHRAIAIATCPVCERIDGHAGWCSR